MTKGKLLVSFQPTLETRLFPFSSLKSQVVAQWNLTWTLGPDWRHTGGTVCPHTHLQHLTHSRHLCYIFFIYTLKRSNALKMFCLASLFCAKRNFRKTTKTSGNLFLQHSAESWLQAGSFLNGGTGWWWSAGLSSRSDDPRCSGPYGALCCWNRSSGSNGRCPELQKEKWETLTSVDAEQAQS